MNFESVINSIDTFVWGPVMLVLLVGTGVFLTFRLRFMTWRNLGYAIRSVMGRDARRVSKGAGDVSPFASLCTALASTIGTGNIVGVATAMFTGGPGALVWMEISALFGLSTKYSECMLSVKYREVNAKGEIAGGPMYTMKNGLKNKRAGAFLGFLFALFTSIASFGIGNMTQANSISGALRTSFGVPAWITGILVMILVLLIVIGGIKSISKVSTVVVPLMAICYVLAGLLCLILGWRNIPHGLYQIFVMAFSPKSVGGGVLGTITVNVMNEMRYGVARGCFSNEAGLGSAAITSAAATTDDIVKQGYINMTGTFFDTLVVCTITGLVIASSGVLGTCGPDGVPYEGVALTMAAFATYLGPIGNYIISIGIVLFAFSTIIGWEYNGEKAFEYLCPNRYAIYGYRILFAIVTFFGATQALSIVWSLSDIANALMAIPNLLSLVLLSGVVLQETERFQKTLRRNKSAADAESVADAASIDDAEI